MLCQFCKTPLNPGAVKCTNCPATWRRGEAGCVTKIAQTVVSLLMLPVWFIVGVALHVIFPNPWMVLLIIPACIAGAAASAGFAQGVLYGLLERPRWYSQDAPNVIHKTIIINRWWGPYGPHRGPFRD